jgi:hypothetical protein
MMGLHDEQASMFRYNVNLEKRVRGEHPLRRVAAVIDFTFARKMVAHTYGQNGHGSVDPAELLKLIFLLFCEGNPKGVMSLIVNSPAFSKPSPPPRML